ncbi:DUF883 family protein [Pseudomonas sp. L-22-4S-12]|uniref:DUF883 family protein n=1 Tax=Pseudomonas sp. L-22-4S-12 TaxID=2610893 RepID=UPI001326DDC6|nr:DUF883 family protein [Pseudomonas sp. L-22-4S-12]MWV17378.1 DUF883 family protein [Pseudomonas sp. L-22-4S-12]
MHTPTASPATDANGQGNACQAQANTASACAPSAISREFHNFLADIEDLIKESTSLTGDELARARAKLNDRVAMAKTYAEAMGDNITQHARQTASETNDYVHAQPWKVLGATAAVALLLGIVIARRS